MRRIGACLTGACLGLAVALPVVGAGATAAPATAFPKVVEADCGFSMRGVELQCGSIDVLENRAKPGGRKIPLYFVRAAATGDDAAPDPIVFLAGGPGQHASRSAGRQIGMNRDKLKRRDLIVVDQRGTGRSNPLDCQVHDGNGSLQQLYSLSFLDPVIFRPCVAELSERADLTQYTTTASAHDLDELRAALGYERINVMGGSYGTRLALEFLRRHPESARSAVLVGVAPPSELLVERVARDFQDGLDALVDACEADAACAKAYPEFRSQLKKVIEDAVTQPVVVELPDMKGKARSVRVGHGQLATGIRFLLYSVHQASALPRQVRAAAEGDYRELASNYGGFTLTLRNSIADGMWASVKCSEELPFIDVERARKLSRGTLLGTVRLDDEVEVCSFWPRGEIPDDFHDTVESDVPVLLVAGEFDVASPIALAEKAMDGLSRATLVRVANRSHWGLGGPCVDGLIEAFLATGSGEGLDTGCAEGLERPPFLLPD